MKHIYLLVEDMHKDSANFSKAATSLEGLKQILMEEELQYGHEVPYESIRVEEKEKSGWLRYSYTDEFSEKRNKHQYGFYKLLRYD